MYTPNRYRTQRGFSLMEILVALAVFALIFIAALMIYDRSNREFRSGMERTDMQQSTRVAFEKIVAELRQAGFDYDRDGFPSAAGGAVWQPSKSYSAGNIVTPITANGYTYVAITNGTSGTSQPIWNTTVGGTTNDGAGGLRWRTETGINQYQQPDEQIEYAHRRAITFRANLDYETDSASENGRETALQSLQFPVVTTGNDEIVTYALRSNSGPNPDRINFFVDAPDRRAFPGGRAENQVVIENVDLCTSGTCTGAPYTLYRFTLAPGTGAVVEAPVATNVRDFELTYYSDTIGVGDALVFTPAVSNAAGSSGGGQYNPNLPNTGTEARARRAEIRSIRFKLTGMTASRTASYQNPDETTTSPFRNYPTYSLTSLIVPRNIGKMGVRELQEAPPGEPALLSVCTGWCGTVKVTWQAPPVTAETGEVDQYIVIYDTANPPVRFQKSVGPVVSAYVEGLDPTLRYYFTIAAVNSFGTTVAKTSGGAVETLPVSGPGLQVRNTTTPQAPTDVRASGGTLTGSPAEQPNRITVSWSNPTANVAGRATVTCAEIAGGTTTDNAAPFAQGELQRYEILRGEDPNFDPDDPDEFTLVTTATPNKLTIGASVVSFEDNTAVACINYYYRIRLIERCEGISGANVNPAEARSDFFPAEGDPAVLGRATATARPVAPIALTHPVTLPAPPASSCGVTCAVYLQWPKVTTDTNVPPRTIAVRDYVIERKVMRGATEVRRYEIPVQDTTPGVGQFVTFGPSDTPYYLDDVPAEMPYLDTTVDPPAELKYVYTVRARLACSPSAFISDPSPELRFPCPFGGSGVDVDAIGMTDGDGLAAGTAWQTDSDGGSVLTVDGTGVTSAQVFLLSTTDNEVIDLGTDVAAPYQFGLDGLDAGKLYRAYVIVKDAAGCQDFHVRYIEGGTPSGCCLEAFSDNALIVQFSPNSAFVNVVLRNLCDNPLNIEPNGIKIDWDPTFTPAGTRLVAVEFPGETGGRVNATLSPANTSGTVTLTPPTGARNPIRVGESYLVQLQFDRIIPLPPTAPAGSTPLRSFCVTYRRPGLDTFNQNCRIVPGPPPTPNSCN